MLRRKDNLLKYHFAVYHPDIAPETGRFLKVGERPVEGADHVTWYLDALGTTTERPAGSPTCSVGGDTSEDEPDPKETNSQQAYDEPSSDNESATDALPSESNQCQEVEPPAKT